MSSKQGTVSREETNTRSKKAESCFFRASASDFKKIPGSPIAYWIPNAALHALNMTMPLEEFATLRKGMCTRDNNYFVRSWQEVSILNIGFGCKTRAEAIESRKKWFPYQKGGEFRQWYGNHLSVVDWENDGYRLLHMENLGWQGNSTNHNLKYIFSTALVWSKITSHIPNFRLSPNGFLFDDASGMCHISESANVEHILGYLCSKVGQFYMGVINPTLNIQPGNMAALPILGIGPKEYVADIIEISKSDWDSYETSWDFTTLPLLDPSHHQPTLAETYTTLRAHWRETTLEMQRLEEENNRIFIDAYGLEDELTPDVPISEITLTCNPHYRYGGDRSEEELEALLLADTMRELVSYAVGCMMGRYSLDAPGLIYAHSGNERFWEIYHEKHNKPGPAQDKNHSYNSCDSWSSFSPDEDGIIPITDTDWFPDDAANRFIQFMSVAWPEKHLEENLEFVAIGLGPKRGESPTDTIRRYMTTGFFKHHMKMYKKRPIYWLFSSGKLRAFQCLVYLHRYNEGTLARMRTEYVIPLQGKFSARIEQLSGDISAATSTAHRKKLERERDNLVKQQAELLGFDEKLRHFADRRVSLDLDDGVKVNYGKFGDMLAEVKAVTGKKKKRQ